MNNDKVWPNSWQEKFAQKSPQPREIRKEQVRNAEDLAMAFEEKKSPIFIDMVEDADADSNPISLALNMQEFDSIILSVMTSFPQSRILLL